MTPSRKPNSFGRADRLHRSAEYLFLQRHGIRAKASHFVLYAGRIEKSETSGKRLGITVSGRIGNAIVRNRIKRHVRECYRLTLRDRLPEGTALVVIALAGAGKLDQAAIHAELLAATLDFAAQRTRR